MGRPHHHLGCVAEWQARKVTSRLDQNRDGWIDALDVAPLRRVLNRSLALLAAPPVPGAAGAARR
jgi:hypothetical protein